MSKDKAEDKERNSLVFGDAATIQGDVVGGDKFDIRFYALASLVEKGKIEWLKGQRQRSEPYKFLSYYETTDADIFYGREGVSELLASKISTHKLILINGQSGSGKTSLINAGIIPKLIQKGYFTMVFRDYGYPTEVIKNGLASLKNINLDLSNCQSLLDCLQTTRQQIQRPLVIFFDQFERFFLNLNSSDRQKFIQEFSECLTTINAQEMNFFIAIRQDFYGNLGEFWHEPEFNTENYPHYLETLSEKEAIAAIKNPLTAIPEKIGYENNFVEQTLLPALLQSSERENQKQINPVHLQIVCNELFKKVKETKADDIQAKKVVLIGQELYKDIGKVEGVLRNYVTEILDDKSKFSLQEREIAKSVLKQMVTSQGNRVFRSLEDLTQKLDYSPNQIKPIIKKLDNNRLLETRKENSHTEYSITHEYLAKEINEWFDPKELEIKRVQEMWARCLENWRWHRNTIPRNQYKDINKYKSHLEIDEEDKSLLRASYFAYWGLNVAVGSGMAILIGLTTASLIGNRNATINQIRASVQASEAHFNSQRSLETLVEAVRAAKTLDRNLLLKFFPPNKDRRLDSQVKKVLYQGYKQTYERNRLEGHHSAVTNAQFSRDGQFIVTASDDDTAKLWTSKGELVATLPHQYDVNSAQFSSDGQYIVTASGDNTAKLWTREGELIAILPHQHWVTDAQFSSDGQYIVTASGDNTAKLWTREGELIAILPHQHWVTDAQFSSDGQYIVTASGDNTAKLWTRKGDLVATLPHQDFVISAEFSPDGQYIVTASDDKTAKLWTSKGELVATLESHQYGVVSAEFSPDGQWIVNTSSNLAGNGKTKLWTKEGDLVATLTQDSVNSAEFSSDGQYIVTASGDKTAKLWTIQSESVAMLKHQDRVNSAQFSPDGQYIVTASDDKTAKLWTSKGELVATLEGHQDRVNSAQFSSDGQYIVTASGDNTAKLWTREGELIAILPHQHWVTDAQFSPDGQFIITASDDNTAKLWTRDGDEVATLQHQSWVTDAQFSPDGQYIVTASWDGTAKLWNREGDLVATLEGHQDLVTSAEFSPDGQYIVTASWDDTAKLWNREGDLVATLEGHQDLVTDAQFSPDGQYIVTASQDNMAKLWNREGDLVATLEHQAPVNSAQFSRDGQSIVTSSWDGTANLWNVGNLNLDSMLTQACQEIRDYLKHNADEADRTLCDDIPL